jgi:hypothetical protein
MFQGMPICCNLNSSLPISKQMCEELGYNLPYRVCMLIEGPILTKVALADLTMTVRAFTFLLSNLGCKLTAII